MHTLTIWAFNNNIHCHINFIGINLFCKPIIFHIRDYHELMRAWYLPEANNPIAFTSNFWHNT